MTVTLSAEAGLSADTLHVRYAVENGTNGTIHLLNVVQKWDTAGLHADPAVIYTEVVDGALRLTKANLPVPDDLDVEAPDVPLLTPVERGAAYFEEFTLRVPLTPYHPYDEVEWCPEVVTYDDVALAIGWLPTEVDVRSGARLDGTRVLSAPYQEVVREQRLLVTPLPVAVPTHLRHRSATGRPSRTPSGG